MGVKHEQQLILGSWSGRKVAGSPGTFEDGDGAEGGHGGRHGDFLNRWSRCQQPCDPPAAGWQLHDDGGTCKGCRGSCRGSAQPHQGN